MIRTGTHYWWIKHREAEIPRDNAFFAPKCHPPASRRDVVLWKCFAGPPAPCFPWEVWAGSGTMPHASPRPSLAMNRRRHWHFSARVFCIIGSSDTSQIGASQHDAATSVGRRPVPGKVADSIFICFRDSFSPAICVQLAPAPAPGGQQESFHDSSVSRITPACSPAVRRGSRAGEAACFTTLSGLLSVPTTEQCTFFLCVSNLGVFTGIPPTPAWAFLFQCCFVWRGSPHELFWGAEGRRLYQTPLSIPQAFLLLVSWRLVAAVGRLLILPENMLTCHIYWAHQMLLSHQASREPCIIYFFRNHRLIWFYISQVTSKICIYKSVTGARTPAGTWQHTATSPSALGLSLVPGTAVPSPAVRKERRTAGGYVCQGVLVHGLHFFLLLPPFMLLLDPK